ncbi:MAG: Yip1 family protein [Woeseia sp.]
MLLWLFFRPGKAFEVLADARPEAGTVFLRLVIWLAAIPPVMAYFGGSWFGWRLGAAEPLFLDQDVLGKISLGYFIGLLVGFVSSAVIAKWMASTYGARSSLGIHLSLVTIVAAPLVVGSVIHLYPHVFINVIVLVPALIWSMYLLYRGLPVVLRISPERGMLMASSLIGYVLVAFVCLLGVMVVLWGRGFGPAVGI